MKKKDKIKIVGLLGYVLLACLVVYLWRPVYLVSILIVLLPPSLVNFFWLKESRKKVLFFSAATTLLFALPVELSARLADAWDVQSVLPRIFGIAPLENLLFAFLNFFWVLSFYEYFIDKDRSSKISKWFVRLIFIYCIISLGVFTFYFVDRQLITLSYHELALIILLLPGVILFYFRPKLLKKVWLPTVFFALVFFVYEVVSLLVGSWWWPGDYLLSISILGHTFPLDDVIIWYILSTPVLIAGYEFFADDKK
jgi:hypothetical protein